MRKERLEDIKLEKVLGSSMCQYTVIENKLQILYKNQEQILKAIKLLSNQNEETPEEKLSPEEALIKWCEETSKNKETIEQQAERMYSEEEVRNLLETQRGNCYVALLSHTKSESIASIALQAPEPGGKNGTWVKTI